MRSPSRETSYTTLHHILTYVYIPFSFPTYYSKSSVNFLFEALNEFKLKICQLQSFITFRDLQLSFWFFPHLRSFTKFKIHFAVCQIKGTRQTLALPCVFYQAYGTIWIETYIFVLHCKGYRWTVRTLGADGPLANISSWIEIFVFLVGVES